MQVLAGRSETVVATLQVGSQTVRVPLSSAIPFDESIKLRMLLKNPHKTQDVVITRNIPKFGL